MSWVMKSLRSSMLLSRQNQFEAKLLNISQRIMDLQNYATNVADGVVTFNEAASCPSSLFGTQMNFMVNSSGVAYQSAATKTDAYLQQLQMTQNQTGGQYGLAAGSIDATYASADQQYLLFNEIYKQELKEYTSELTKQINEEEKQLQQEKLRIETQLKAVEAEMQQVSESVTKSIQSDVIKLA